MKTLLLMMLSVLSGAAAVRAEPPHIGYVYPAGGQQGSSFDVVIGGQYLETATNVFVSGKGVEVNVLNYSVRYEARELRNLYRRKENLSATIEERKENNESIEKEQRQMEQIIKKLALTDLPEGVEADNQKQVLRSYSNQPKEQFNPQIAERLRLRISIDPDAEPGDRELRVRAPSGLSNPLFFEVGVLNEILENEPNDDHMGPSLQTVSIPFLINGQVRPGDIDHVRFNAEKGSTLVINVSARRIIPYLADAVPGWFQAVAVLYDQDGNEVAYDDDYKFNPDPILFLKVPESGIYTLAIRDSIYRGREDFVYRIAVGELPFITSIFPLGGQQGRDVDIRLTGWNLPRNSIKGTLPEIDGSTRHLSVNRNGYRSNEMPFALDNLPETFETEPNNSTENAKPVSPPLIVNGLIKEASDRDVFSFQGKKGETVSIRIDARRLNSPLDSMLSLSGPGLETAVLNDDYTPKDSSQLHLGAGLVTHHADSYLLQELPETGTYFVEVRDTQARGGPDFAYRLRVGPAQPDFRLRMEPSGQQIAPGGTAVFNVRATRSEGFAGKITLSATNLPAGFVFSQAEIPEDGNLARITLTAPADMKPNDLCPQIYGTAIIDGKTITHQADPVDDQMQAFLYRHLVPARELVLTSTATPALISFEARIPPSGIIELPLGEEVRIALSGHVHAERRGTNVALDHPPEGISVVKGWIGRSNKAGPKQPKASGSLLIKADEPLKPGDELILIPTAIIKMGSEQIEFPAPSITARIIAPRPSE